MDLSTFAQMLGIGVGAAVASFGATQVVQQRRRRSASDSGDDGPGKTVLDRFVELERRHAVLEARDREIESQLEQASKRHEEQLQLVERAVRECVKSEDFGAYTQHTTNAVQQLGEKVGHVTGLVEGWRRSRQ